MCMHSLRLYIYIILYISIYIHIFITLRYIAITLQENT